MSISASIGQIFFFLALFFGIFFSAYALKYYFSIVLVFLGSKRDHLNGENGGTELHGRDRGLNHELSRNATGKTKDKNTYSRNGPEKHEPFVSIHLPFYNEKNVASRIITACLKIDYSNYEVLVLDDSRDETIGILKELCSENGSQKIKIIHRKDRQGFKGGALAEAVKHMDPRTEYIAVFDADFILPPGIIRQFLQYFENYTTIVGNDNEREGLISNISGEKRVKASRRGSAASMKNESSEYNVAAVQGYQLHYLNKNENWITKGVRAEYSGSYMIERVAQEFLGAMKMISGSVFMVRSSLVKKLGWTTSITEDWDLTLRLYLSGYKVVYTPLIQAPAEIPSTISRLVRQRMRWAEGHTFCVKKYFWELFRSRVLTLREKLEFIYYAPYYLQSLFLVVGSFSWIAAELLYHQPTFWTSTLGWSLIIGNLLALPLMSAAGLFFESKAREDLAGIFSLIVLSYVIAPFQAYAALKGLLEKEEGTWIRTLKTGSITDKVLQIKVRRVIDWVMPKRRRGHKEKRVERPHKALPLLIAFVIFSSSLLVWITAETVSKSSTNSMERDFPKLEYVYLPSNITRIEKNRILNPYSNSNPKLENVDYDAIGIGSRRGYTNSAFFTQSKMFMRGWINL